jgi:hypothetical protein
MDSPPGLEGEGPNVCRGGDEATQKVLRLDAGLDRFIKEGLGAQEGKCSRAVCIFVELNEPMVANVTSNRVRLH